MKRLLPLLIFLAGIIPALNAQRHCGTMEYLQSQIQQDPTLEQRIQTYETEIDQWIKANQDYVNTTKSTITIPVVVHIVYNTSTQNISDDRVYEQIDILNRDYAGLNPHSMYNFSSTLKTNTELQFCLAKKKADGTATTGIERRVTTNSTFGTNDNVKFYSKGGLNAWDPTKYLNIWVCDLGTSLCGYAQFPTTGINSTFGVVINYRFFGVTGAIAPYNLGGTTTHEIGHCFNLYHIWGDDNGSCSGTDVCNDTPNQANANYGVPAFPHVTCNNAPNGDMFMNFMDYTDDIAYANFTPNQKARVQALFAPGGLLYSLSVSDACQAPVATCDAPSGLVASSITYSGATLGWNAVSGAISYNVQYKEASATSYTSVATTTNSLVVSGLSPVTGYQWQVQTVCNDLTGNWSSIATFTTADSSSVTTCNDTYEPNGTSNTAKVIPLNTNIFASIGTATDKDYFKFTTTKAASKIKISLTNLPADLDMKLYKGKTLVSTSQNNGTANEAIIYNNKNAATYTVYIYGYNGAYNADQCYNLIVETASSNFKGIATASDEPDTPLQISVYPNPVKDFLTIEYNTEFNNISYVNIYDISGRNVLSNEYQSTKGLNKYLINMGNMVEGLYLIELINNNDRIVRKIILDK